MRNERDAKDVWIKTNIKMQKHPNNDCCSNNFLSFTQTTIPAVSEQLKNAARPCMIELIRFENKEDGTSKSKEVANALMPWKSTTDFVGLENININIDNPLGFDCENPLAAQKMMMTKKRSGSTPKKSDLRVSIRDVKYDAKSTTFLN